MIPASVLLACALGWLLALANGANDVSKGVATVVGAGELDEGRALRWGTAWTVLGVLLGSVVATRMITTLGKGLLVEGAQIPAWVGVSMLLGASGWVLLATRVGWPVSTTHAIVGAVVGVVGVHLGVGALRWDALATRVAAPLVLSPIVAFAVVWLWVRSHPRGRGAAADCLCVEAGPSVDTVAPGALALSSAAVRVTSGPAATCARTFPTALRLTWRRAHLGSAALVSFARGLNDGPKIVALTLAATATAGDAGRVGALATVAVAAGMALGGLGAGRRVLALLAHRVTTMDDGPAAARTNLVTGGLVVAGAVLGLPMSTTHVSGGGILGLGARRTALHGPSVRTMLLAWVVTLPLAGAIGVGAWVLGSLWGLA